MQCLRICWYCITVSRISKYVYVDLSLRFKEFNLKAWSARKHIPFEKKLAALGFYNDITDNGARVLPRGELAKLASVTSGYLREEAILAETPWISINCSSGMLIKTRSDRIFQIMYVLVLSSYLILRNFYRC